MKITTVFLPLLLILVTLSCRKPKEGTYEISFQGSKNLTYTGSLKRSMHVLKLSFSETFNAGSGSSGSGNLEIKGNKVSGTITTNTWGQTNTASDVYKLTGTSHRHSISGTYTLAGSYPAAHGIAQTYTGEGTFQMNWESKE